MNITNSPWRQPYQEALLELDQDKLLFRVEMAEQAIHEHTNNAMSLDPEEQLAIRDALRALSLLHRNSRWH